MRWLFIGVVALNLLYFGWRMTGAGDVPANIQGEAQEEKDYPASLTLLSEKGAGAATTTPAQPAAAISGCPAVGPWANDGDAQRVAKSLAGAGVTAAVRSVDIKNAVVYWVYMPPYGQRAQALRKLRELQAKGIDSFVVSDGADINAISLGSFTSKDSALGVQSRLRAAGYAAEIREQARDVQQVWVVLKSATAQGYLEFVPTDLRDRARQERLPCN